MFRSWRYTNNMSTQILDESYWNSRYENSQTGWDIGAPSTPLVTYFKSLTDRSLRILIPGCGNGYEAGWLLENGFTNLTVIDIAPSLTASLQEKYQYYSGKQLHVITGNFFELEGSYDLIVEQTFFCALDPVLRSDYARKMHQLLAPVGKLMGVLFNREFEGGPPFGGNSTEYEALFSPLFHLHKLEACYNSIPPRMGSEVFILFEKKEP